jgi:hypothetical protein
MPARLKNGLNSGLFEGQLCGSNQVAETMMLSG